MSRDLPPCFNENLCVREVDPVYVARHDCFMMSRGHEGARMTVISKSRGSAYCVNER